MRKVVNTGNKPLTIRLHVETSSPQSMRIMAFDRSRPNTYYINRGGDVKKERVFDIPMPQTPDRLEVVVFNKANGIVANDSTFKVKKMEVIGLQKWQIWLKKHDREFIDFAQEFSEKIGDSPTGVYTSDTGRFKIKYFDVIRNKKGNAISTPARISNKNGTIEVSRKDFIKYNIPMRMMILFHEYCHFYVNEKQSSEIQADVNGLYMYLGLGYPRVEAHRAFLTVFSGADTKQNDDRYKVIKDYIFKFDKGRIVNEQPYIKAKLVA